MRYYRRPAHHPHLVEEVNVREWVREGLPLARRVLDRRHRDGRWADRVRCVDRAKPRHGRKAQDRRRWRRP